MEFKAIISVFVASPSDVEAERSAVDEVVAELNALDLEGGKVRLEVKKWETHTWPGFGDDAQSVINEQIGDYDIFLGMFWNRLGSPTKRAKSGTVEEFDRAYELWKKHQRPSLMFYFKDAASNLRSQSELKQRSGVIKFEKAVQKRGLTSSFSSTQDFKVLVRRHLSSEIRKIIQRSEVAAQPVANGSGPVEAMSRLVSKLGYWHVGPTLRAISQIEQACADSPADAKRAAIRGLRDFLMVGMTQDDEAATERARTLRVEAFRAIRACAADDLADYFKEGELEAVDLVRIDFSGLKLQGVGFRSSFLIEADFRNTVVDDCSFEGAYLRNVDFAGASLRNADMRDADWFNALGLTKTQIRSAKNGTLLPMPGSVEALHKYLSGRYGMPFESWTDEVKTKLTTAWKEYLQEGGLGQTVAK